MPEETPEEKLARFETVIDLQMKEIDRLRAEVARLTEGADAISTLRSIYRDRDLPESLRAKAAIGCLPHEVPRLTPQPPAIDSTCEEIEPLAVVVERQRKRCDAGPGHSGAAERSSVAWQRWPGRLVRLPVELTISASSASALAATISLHLVSSSV
jgi:hypothetical protein